MQDRETDAMRWVEFQQRFPLGIGFDQGSDFIHFSCLPVVGHHHSARTQIGLKILILFQGLVGIFGAVQEKSRDSFSRRDMGGKEGHVVAFDKLDMGKQMG